MPYANMNPSDTDKMDRCIEKVMGQGHDKESAIAICYTSITGKEYRAAPSVEQIGSQYRVYDANSGVTLKQVDSVREAMTLMVSYRATAEVNDLPDSAFLHIEAGGEKDDTGKTVPRDFRHLPYRTTAGAVDLPRLRNALARLGQTDTGVTGGEKWLTASLRESLRKKAEGILSDNTDAESAEKEVKPSFFQQVINAVKGVTTEKAGKRNSNTDAGRLQQIHDLAVENGAACPMVFKEASGRYRWVMFSTNSYEDSDKEIVSQKALEDDVERMDASGQYGPLRWWHVGTPDTETKEAGQGVDIGTCDYSAMLGRIGVESGTFVNERIGEAIKEHAPELKGSIGFFHSVDQPDPSGTYQTMHRFERSLLPARVASNQLTALPIITKENGDMASQKEKIDELTKLLGGDAALVDSIVKQAAATEKQANEKGLRYKGTDDEPTQEPLPEPEPAPPVEPVPTEKEGAAVMPHGMGGLMSAFGLEADDDDKTVKEKVGGVFKAMLDQYMQASAQERTDKEAAIGAQITTLETSLKAVTDSVKELQGDMPRGVHGGFRAALSEATIINANFKQSPSGDPLDSVIDQLMGKGK